MPRPRLNMQRPSGQRLFSSLATLTLRLSSWAFFTSSSLGPLTRLPPSKFAGSSSGRGAPWLRAERLQIVPQPMQQGQAQDGARQGTTLRAGVTVTAARQ